MSKPYDRPDKQQEEPAPIESRNQSTAPEEAKREPRRNSGQTPTLTAPKKTAFVQKLYNMLNDPKLSHLIWWSRGDEDGVFALHPCTEFATALTTYFKHGNVSSFVRQLHMYGFHKVFDTYNEEHPPSAPTERGSDDLVWEFRHSTGAFRKGDEESLSLIKRRSSNRTVPEEHLRLPEYPAPPLIQHQQLQQHQQHAGPHYYYPMAHPVPGVVHYVPQGQEQFPHPQMQQVVYLPQHLPQSRTPQPQQSSTSSTPTTQHGQLPRPSSRQMSMGVAPEQVVMTTAQEIATQQQEIAARADHVTEIQRATSGDVIKIGDQLPKIAPTLKQTGQRFTESLGQLQQSFQQRARSCTPDPPVEPHHQIQQQQVQHVQHTHTQPPFAPQMMNPFTQGAAQRAQSIHFWERSSARQPSVFVDPLNPVPQHHASSPMGSTPSSPSQSVNSSQRSSTVSMSAVPPHFQHPHPLSHQQPYLQQHAQQQGRAGTSAPHIHFNPGSPTVHGAQRRTDSLPTHFPPPPPPPAATHVQQHPQSHVHPHAHSHPQSHSHPPHPSHQRQFAPRSIPDDHQPHHSSHPLHHMSTPQQQPGGAGRSNGSIPNMTHLNSRLRPSLLEFYNNNPHHGQQITTSLSSTSTYSTVYSAQSSISSISSRNSQGSFSGMAEALHRQQIEAPTSPVSKVEEKSNSATPSMSKVAVSSLLSSPGSKDDGKKRGSESGKSHEGERGLKKVKSTSNLR